jgi:hypothetical protein
MSKPLNWPSREEWAYRRQHPYWDSDTGCPFADKYGHRLSDYASAEEIAVLIAALKDLYRKLGRELRTANLRIKPSDRQQRGEGHAAWYRRFKLLAREEQELFHTAEILRSDRTEINDVLAKIHDDQIPLWTRRGSVLGPACELITSFVERYDAAFKAAREQWERECEQKISIDDAAWEEELQRRTDCEARRRA